MAGADRFQLEFRPVQPTQKNVSIFQTECVPLQVDRFSFEQSSKPKVFIFVCQFLHSSDAHAISCSHPGVGHEGTEAPKH
jgi:hypothetical protein